MSPHSAVSHVTAQPGWGGSQGDLGLGAHPWKSGSPEVPTLVPAVQAPHAGRQVRVLGGRWEASGREGGGHKPRCTSLSQQVGRGHGLEHVCALGKGHVRRSGTLSSTLLRFWETESLCLPVASPRSRHVSRRGSWASTVTLQALSLFLAPDP